MVRQAPRLSQRRPEVMHRSRRQAGRPAHAGGGSARCLPSAASRHNRRVAWNSAVCTKRAWSPVAMPVSAIAGSSAPPPPATSVSGPGCARQSAPSVHRRPPPAAPRPRPRRQAGVGVQEQQHLAARPLLRRCSSGARGRVGWSARRRPRARPSAAVPSRLPPSTTTSCPAARSGARACSVAVTPAASSSTGTMDIMGQASVAAR
jgi:hypothetical protein